MPAVVFSTAAHPFEHDQVGRRPPLASRAQRRQNPDRLAVTRFDVEITNMTSVGAWPDRVSGKRPKLHIGHFLNTVDTDRPTPASLMLACHPQRQRCCLNGVTTRVWIAAPAGRGTPRRSPSALCGEEPGMAGCYRAAGPEGWNPWTSASRCGSHSLSISCRDRRCCTADQTADVAPKRPPAGKPGDMLLSWPLSRRLGLDRES